MLVISDTSHNPQHDQKFHQEQLDFLRLLSPLPQPKRKVRESLCLYPLLIMNARIETDSNYHYLMVEDILSSITLLSLFPGGGGAEHFLTKIPLDFKFLFPISFKMVQCSTILFKEKSKR